MYKTFADGRGTRMSLPCELVGTHTDKDGLTWNVYKPIGGGWWGNYRLERADRRARLLSRNDVVDGPLPLDGEFGGVSCKEWEEFAVGSGLITQEELDDDREPRQDEQDLLEGVSD